VTWIEAAPDTRRLVRRRITWVSIVATAVTLVGLALGTGFCVPPWQAATKADVAVVQAALSNFEPREKTDGVREQVIRLDEKVERMSKDIERTTNATEDIKINLYELMSNIGVKPKRGRR